MNEEIHVCPPTWPSGPAWEAWCDDFEECIRADERRRIEAEDAQKWQGVREIVRDISRPPRWAQLADIREQAFRDAADAMAAARAKQDNKISLTKRAAA